MNANWQSKQLDIAYFHYKLARYAMALDICVSILESAPTNPEALYLSAVSRIQLRDYDRGAAELLSVMQNYPDRNLYNEYYENLLQAQRTADSIELFEAWAKQNPDDFLVHLFLGLVRFHSRDLNGASSSFERALELDPSHAPSWSGLAGTRNEQWRFHEAEEYWRKALDLVPDSYVYLHNIAGVLKTRGRADEAELVCRRAIELAPTNSGIQSHRLMNLLCSTATSPEDIFNAHLEWGQQRADSLGIEIRQHANIVSPDRPLRIGYVSGDYRSHPVAFFIQPVLLRHDNSHFEIHLYSNVGRPDFITAQFKKLNCIWHDITHEKDEAVSEMIQQDGIDILVDLAGHTKDNRLLVFARKPAPVQVTWLGYANTTGLTTIDYRITDAVADPPGTTEHLHSEALFRLPRSFITYCSPQHPPEVGSLPAQGNNFITFGAFNAFAKTSEAIFRIWSEILHKVPNSRLMMKLPGGTQTQMRDYIYEIFERFGINRDRIELVEWFPGIMDHLNLFNSVDIALDVYPYNGTTTTCEALFMGVPVISLAGRVHVSRVGATLLEQAGFSELVANTDSEYINKAVELALDLDRLAQIRASLREAILQSPLMDTGGFTRTLESAYRKMWHIWCEKQNGGKNS
jgi:predicted O-linked N-acetylglucosamine transferase (SPINDLY family)